MSYTPPPVAFQTPITIRWSDQDINGHVNNARALTLVEEARIKASDHWAGGSAERHRFPGWCAVWMYSSTGRCTTAAN